MNWSMTVRTAIVCAILIVLHFTVRPLLAWRAGIDFLVIALIFGAVRLRPGAAALFGFLLGLAADSLALNAFGANALAMTVVGFSASWLKARTRRCAADARRARLPDRFSTCEKR